MQRDLIINKSIQENVMGKKTEIEFKAQEQNFVLNAYYL